MTSELVKRLREAAADYTIAWGNGDLYEQAADELDRLTSAAPAEGVGTVTAAMVDRFLSWPLPDSVCADLCASDLGYPHRFGTNLLTAAEARKMLEHVLSALPIDAATEQQNAQKYQDLDSELRWIFGQMCFQCIDTARCLRLMEHEIPKRAEHEQAASISWMLSLYKEHGKCWREKAIAMLDAAMLAQSSPQKTGDKS